MATQTQADTAKRSDTQPITSGGYNQRIHIGGHDFGTIFVPEDEPFDVTTQVQTTADRNADRYYNYGLFAG